MDVTLVADVERYNSIADRWPPRIIVCGATEDQLDHLLTHGLFEAGCDDLYYRIDESGNRVE